MATIDIDRLKAVHRRTWATGDYAAVSDAITDQVAPLVLERGSVHAGQAVLDVATGTGNVALLAAQAGGGVAGVDPTPPLPPTPGPGAPPPGGTGGRGGGGGGPPPAE